MQKHSWQFDKISKYLLGAILIIVPLFPKFPLVSVSGTYVAIRFEDILLLLLGITILLKVVPNYKFYLRDKVIISIIIFFVVGLTSLISGAFLTHTVNFKIGLLHLLRRGEYLLPFIAMITLLNKDKVGEHLNYYIKILLLVTFVAFLYGIGQRYFHFPIIITQNEEYSKGVALYWTPGSHINSTFAGHYDEAAVMVIFLTIFISLITLFSKTYATQIFLLLATGSGMWLLINSLSRIAQVGYLLAISVSLLLLKKVKILVLLFVVSIALIGMSSSLGGRFSRVFEVFYQKINIKKITNSVSNFTVMAADAVIPEKRVNTVVPTVAPVPVFEDRSTSIRLNVEWPRAIRAFKKNFILGTGYSSINLATDNDYLRLLGETGILGFFAFFLIFFRIFKELKKGLVFNTDTPLIYKGFITAVVGSVAGTFLSSFFLDLFEASKFAILFWFILGLALYIVRNNNYVEKNN